MTTSYPNQTATTLQLIVCACGRPRNSGGKNSIIRYVGRYGIVQKKSNKRTLANCREFVATYNCDYPRVHRIHYTIPVANFFEKAKPVF